jgi:hypothetical protein
LGTGATMKDCIRPILSLTLMAFTSCGDDGPTKPTTPIRFPRSVLITYDGTGDCCPWGVRFRCLYAFSRKLVS